MVEAIKAAKAKGAVTGVAIRDAMYDKKDWVPAGLEGVCLPSTWTATDHRGLMTVPIYQGHVKGATQGKEVTALMADGTMSLEKVAEITLPRRPEWLGYLNPA